MEATGRPDFGTLLKQFRLSTGMTQHELAERANLSVEAIGALERGARTRPQRETLVLLGRALKLSSEHQELLASAIGAAHPPRRRKGTSAISAPLLRIVRPQTQAASNHNLPQQLTSFIGRRRELDEIGALLFKRRLVIICRSGRSRENAGCN